MEQKVFRIDDISLSAESLAEYIEEQLKMMTIGSLVQLFRSHAKLELLKEMMPFLSKGNQLALEDVFDGKTYNRYY